MMKTGEVSELTGISKKTLQRYENCGLISPQKTEKGYMLFSEEDLFTLLLVKLFKDLGYKTAEIKAAISEPDFDVRRSLDARISELEIRLRKDKERLLFAREMKKLLENEDGPNTGEAMCALLRHPEYAWVFTSDEGKETKEAAAYFKWLETNNERISNANPDELDATLNQIIDEAKEFGPAAQIWNRLVIGLLSLQTQGISASSREAETLVAESYKEMEASYEDDQYGSFYLLGKLYGNGGLTPPSVMARLDDQSMKEIEAAESYIGEAIKRFVEKMELTEDRRKEIESLED